MSRRLLVAGLLSACFLAGGMGTLQAQERQPRGVPEDTPNQTAPSGEVSISSRNYVFEWIVVGLLTAGAVFVVGRSSGRQ